MTLLTPCPGVVQAHMLCPIWQQSPNFLTPGTNFVEDNSSMDRVGWFQVDSSTLHLCSLLLHQFYLKSSDVRSWSLGTPAILDLVNWSLLGPSLVLTAWFLPVLLLPSPHSTPTPDPAASSDTRDAQCKPYNSPPSIHLRLFMKEEDLFLQSLKSSA